MVGKVEVAHHLCPIETANLLGQVPASEDMLFLPAGSTEYRLQTTGNHQGAHISIYITDKWRRMYASRMHIVCAYVVVFHVASRECRSAKTGKRVVAYPDDQGSITTLTRDDGRACA